MPQLDASSYFGQVTVLVSVFGLLYRTLVGMVLPRRSRMVKIRAKRVEARAGESTNRGLDVAAVTSKYNATLAGSASTSNSLLNGQETQMVKWVEGAQQEVTENPKYQRSYGRRFKTVMKRVLRLRERLKVVGRVSAKKVRLVSKFKVGKSMLSTMGAKAAMGKVGVGVVKAVTASGKAGAKAVTTKAAPAAKSAKPVAPVASTKPAKATKGSGKGKKGTTSK